MEGTVEKGLEKGEGRRAQEGRMEKGEGRSTTRREGAAYFSLSLFVYCRNEVSFRNVCDGKA